VRVTRLKRDAPAICRPRAVARTLIEFLGRFSEGDPTAAELFDPDMQWFSFSSFAKAPGRDRPSKRHFVARSPEAVARYTERRAPHNDRMKLAEVNVSYSGLAHIAYYLRRSADDVAPGKPIVIGKGAVECETGLLHVLSMGHDHRFQIAPETCPGRPPHLKIAIACSRGR